MSLFSDFAFAAACGLFPNLDTPRVEARWCALGEGLSARRLLAGSMAALMLVGTLPVRAQTTDVPAFQQRAVEFGKNDKSRLQLTIKNSQDDTNWTNNWFRGALMAYKAYQQGAAMYRRLDNGNIDIAYIVGMPTVDLATDLGNGQTENIVLRPILRPQDRLGKFVPPHVVLPDFSLWLKELKNGNIEIDRFVARSSNPDAGKSTDQLHREAVQDAWQQWAQVQQVQGVPQTNVTMPNNPSPYMNVSPAFTDYYQTRQTRLQGLCQQALTAYGQESPQYAAALAAYQDWSEKIANNQAAIDSALVTNQLGALDADSIVAMEDYATHAMSMKLAVQREDVNRKKIDSIAALYDSTSKDVISKIDAWLGYSQLITTIQAITDPTAGTKQPDTPNRDMLGNAMKQTVHQQEISGNQANAVKLENRKAMAAAIDKMRALAAQKTSLLNDTTTKTSLSAVIDDTAALKISTGLQLSANDALILASKLPDGQTLVLPAPVARLVPGAMPPDQAGQALSASLDAASKTAADTATAGINDALSGPVLGWGWLQLFANGLSQGLSSATGRAFNLSGFTKGVPS